MQDIKLTNKDIISIINGWKAFDAIPLISGDIADVKFFDNLVGFYFKSGYIIYFTYGSLYYNFMKYFDINSKPKRPYATTMPNLHLTD